ncbi:uncharacterized protein VP01_10000g1, partial [Puccinia sorghi]
ILLHTVTYPDQFPTDSRKVAFAVSFMKDYAATWSQPYLMKSSSFDHNRQHRAEVALQSLRQTGKVLAYMQEFNSQAHTIGWAKSPLMSLYQHGLKENIQLAVVMSNIQQARQWKASGMVNLPPSASSSAPTTNPNAMDLSAFQHGPHNQLSDAKRTFRVQLNLCFCCGQVRHVSCGCSNGKRKS